MEKSNNQSKFIELRNEYSFFAYKSFEYTADDELTARFTFSLADKYFFYPEFKIQQRNFLQWKSLSTDAMDTLVFHIGMVELISYWKTACPKRLIIEPFVLSEKQKNWWKKLYYNGLGEFFYLNNISVSLNDFMSIETPADAQFSRVEMLLQERCLIPVGGGKDSVVTLEALKNNFNCHPMIVNARQASAGCALKAGFVNDDIVLIDRKLDATMLKLNAEGFLNGHTPFSALLAFFSVLVGFASSSRYIALSNESSANESTVPDTEINHQYSKSIVFETDFRNYINDYINSDIQYFSFLRPLSELQIAALFSRHFEYFEVFKSCNAGSKTDVWCGHCPKCLFTWLILSPFISREQLISIFHKDLLADTSLLTTLKQLAGKSEIKPFECVGTIDEVATCVNNIKRHDSNLKNTIVESFETLKSSDLHQFISGFNTNHYLPKEFVQILKNNLKQIQ